MLHNMPEGYTEKFREGLRFPARPFVGQARLKGVVGQATKESLWKNSADELTHPTVLVSVSPPYCKGGD